MAGDVLEQLLLAVAAPDEAKPVKLAFGVVERAFSLLPRLREGVAVLRHAPELFALFRAGFELLDLRAGVMEWSGGQRLLVDGLIIARCASLASGIAALATLESKGPMTPITSGSAISAAMFAAPTSGSWTPFTASSRALISMLNPSSTGC